MSGSAFCTSRGAIDASASAICRSKDVFDPSGTTIPVSFDTFEASGSIFCTFHAMFTLLVAQILRLVVERCWALSVLYFSLHML